jgi:hypothetical protein
VIVAPLSAIDATRTSPAVVPAGFVIASDETAVELVVVAELWKTMGPPAAGVDVGVGVGVANDVQVVLKYAFMRLISKISTKWSGGSGAISYRAGAGGTDWLKLPVR